MGNAGVTEKGRFGLIIRRLSKAIPTFAPDFSDPETLQAWWDALSGFDEEDLVEACSHAVKTMNRFPAVADLIGLMDQDAGRNFPMDAEEVAGLIEGAISRHGSWNEGEARAMIGEVGWEVVRITGGWTKLCDCQTDELPSLRRQWRELSKSVMRKSEAGITEPPCLPPPAGARTTGLTPISDMCKKYLKEEHNG